MGRSKELVKNTAILTFGKMCTQFVSFILLPLYTALLNPEEFGVVDLFSTYVSLLLPLVCWQFDQGLFRFMLEVRGDEQQVNKLFSSITVVNVLQCVGVTALCTILCVFVKTEYLFYLLFAVVLNVFSGLLMQFARGLGKMIQFSIASFLTASSTVLLNVIAIVVFQMGARGMLLALLGGLVINCLYLSFVLKIWHFFDIRLFDWGIVKKVGQYSLPLVPNQISGWVLSASNRTIITFFLGVEINGIFSVANKFNNLIGTFYGFFNMAWVETVSLHFYDPDRDLFIGDMIQKVLGFFLSLCMGVVAVMPFVFPFMVDAQYSAAYQQIPILMLSVFFQVLVGLYSAIYIAMKMSATIARTTIVGAVANVLIHMALISVAGLYAASIATMLSYAIVAAYRSLDVRKYVNLRFSPGFYVKCIVIMLFPTISYYINNQILNCVMLFVVAVAAVILNRDIIMRVLKMVKHRWV